MKHVPRRLLPVFLLTLNGKVAVEAGQGATVGQSGEARTLCGPMLRVFDSATVARIVLAAPSLDVRRHLGDWSPGSNGVVMLLAHCAESCRGRGGSRERESSELRIIGREPVDCRKDSVELRRRERSGSSEGERRSRRTAVKGRGRSRGGCRA